MPCKLFVPIKVHAITGIGFVSAWTKQMSSMVTATSRGRKIDVESIEQKLDLPIKPKKPNTPYLLYMMERKQSILRDQPGMSVVPLSKIIANEWKNVDRTQYVRAYESAHSIYKKKLEEYNESLTQEQKDYLKIRDDLRRQHNAFKELRKACPPPKQPIHKSSMYTRHTLAKPEYKELIKQKPMGEIFKQVHEEYQNLSDEEKDKYERLAQEDRVRYEKELDEWYAKIKADLSIRKSVREQANVYYTNFRSKSS